MAVIFTFWMLISLKFTILEVKLGWHLAAMTYTGDNDTCSRSLEDRGKPWRTGDDRGKHRSPRVMKATAKASLKQPRFGGRDKYEKITKPCGQIPSWYLATEYGGFDMEHSQETTYTFGAQQCIVTAVYNPTGETFADCLLRLLQADADPCHFLAPQQQ